MRVQKKQIIGITGGVGAGKSTVLAILKETFGADIYLADSVAHTLMEPGTEGLRRVTEALGTGFLAPDGTVDKKALAKRIFHDEEALRTLNAIIHPLVWNTLKTAAESSEKKLAVVEAAVFDTAPEGLFNEIWYVYASRETRIRRLMESRGYSREKCESIIAAQESEEAYRLRCSRIIDNNGSPRETEKQLKEIFCHEIC